MQEQDQSPDEPPLPSAPSRRRRICKTGEDVPGKCNTRQRSGTAAALTRTRRHSKHQMQRGRSKSAYFLYMLIGVHRSHVEAQQAHAQLAFAESLPVTYQRNANGLGQCNTWMAISRPFEREALAQVALRQISPFVGEGAVRVARGAVT